MHILCSGLKCHFERDVNHMQNIKIYNLTIKYISTILYRISQIVRHIISIFTDDKDQSFKTPRSSNITRLFVIFLSPNSAIAERIRMIKKPWSNSSITRSIINDQHQWSIHRLSSFQLDKSNCKSFLSTLELFSIDNRTDYTFDYRIIIFGQLDHQVVVSLRTFIQRDGAR